MQPELCVTNIMLILLKQCNAADHHKTQLVTKVVQVGGKTSLFLPVPAGLSVSGTGV